MDIEGTWKVWDCWLYKNRRYVFIEYNFVDIEDSSKDKSTLLKLLEFNKKGVKNGNDKRKFK